MFDCSEDVIIQIPFSPTEEGVPLRKWKVLFGEKYFLLYNNTCLTLRTYYVTQDHHSLLYL